MKLRIIDDMAPEDVAMLQALYSRSPASVDAHLPKVQGKGSGKFMEQYYVGYGHASIGDCGTVTLFIEGVTLPQAKAIQDWPLYSGQEASTRYLDFANTGFANPARDQELGKLIQESWLGFYTEAMPMLKAHIRDQHPRPSGPGVSDATYERTVAARAFDILRGFLPAGVKTNLSWHTNLRQARDKLGLMECHPDPAMLELAAELHDALAERYPQSFNTTKDRNCPSKSRYLRQCEGYRWALATDPTISHTVQVPFGMRAEVQRLRGILGQRPRGCLLPKTLDECGLVRSEFYLDYGSWRDVQRHRAGTVRVPTLETQFGFEPWYLEQLPTGLRQRAEALLVTQGDRIQRLGESTWVTENYVALGYRVPCVITQPLPAFVYRVELRSGQTVHPTLRALVQQEAKQLQELLPELLLYVDMDPDKWSTRRGQQTITEKEPS